MPAVYSLRRPREIPDGAVRVDRRTKFGNPFKVGIHGKQGECVELFRQWIWRKDQIALRRQIRAELRGKDLVCWCSPLPCHADVLMEIANGNQD